MKRILALTLCLGMAMPLIADAKPKDKEEKEAKRAQKRAEKIERKLRPQVQQARSESRDARRFENAESRIRSQVVARPEREVQPQVAVEQAVAPEVNTQVERRDIRPRNIERRGPRTHSWSYDEARRYHRRERRDRSWWRSNYSRFALFGGGYYYWDRGYWYPAYGYDPAYSTYIYDEPIYGYNQMEPGRVLVNVQRALRREGYYRGAIDGLIGPQTRAALARYQRDNGLYVTRRIDGPTLAALGLV